MSHVYRCSRCRTRNSFKEPVRNWRPVKGLKYTDEDIAEQVKWSGGAFCHSCGYTVFYVDKERVNRRPCHCSGYPWPSHRPGSPLCLQNPWAPLYAAREAGCDEETLQRIREYVVSTGVTKPAPF